MGHLGLSDRLGHFASGDRPNAGDDYYTAKGQHDTMR